MMRSALSLLLCVAAGCAGIGPAASTRPTAALPDRLAGCYSIAPTAILRLNRQPHELLSAMLEKPVWTLDMLDLAGNVQPVPAGWNSPMIYWSADSARLTVVYSSGYQGDVFRFDLAAARGDTLPGETAQTNDVGPYESPAMGAVAVRRACPGA